MARNRLPAKANINMLSRLNIEKMERMMVNNINIVPVI
jgi:hypothetical protein